MASVLAPETMDALFAGMRTGESCQLLAGGTDLLVDVRERRKQPERLISLEKVPELHGIAVADGSITIGAATTLERVVQNELVRRHLDVLCQAIGVLASPPVVHMATVGGNICTASPAGDTLPPLHVLGAEVELHSQSGSRRMPISRFITGPKKTALQSCEVLTRVHVPIPAPGCRSAFWKVGLRQAQSIALVSLAACIWSAADGALRDVRLAWGSVGPQVLAFPEIEAALRGKPLSGTLLREASARVEELVMPIDDVRATAAYRRRVAGNLLFRLAELQEIEP